MYRRQFDQIKNQDLHRRCTRTYIHFLKEKRVFAILLKRRIYYREQSGKGFKATLAVTEKDLEKYLESWDPDGDLLGFFFKCFDDVITWGPIHSQTDVMYTKEITPKR